MKLGAGHPGSELKLCKKHLVKGTSVEIFAFNIFSLIARLNYFKIL